MYVLYGGSQYPNREALAANYHTYNCKGRRSLYYHHIWVLALALQGPTV